MKQESTVDLLLDVDQRPSDGKGILLSFQHVFAMFGATILVPLILGMPVSVALFASGVGTLIYMIATGFKVPVYLGSSFAFITAMSLAMKEMGGDVSAAQTGVILTGLVYVLVATSIRFVGTKWIDKLLPPIIIGPMIIVIGLGLAGSAVTNAGLVADGNWKNTLVAVVTFLIAAFINTKGKGFLRIIPFLFAIIGGYLFALTLGLVDFTPVLKANWFEIPGFYLPFSTGGAFKEYNLYFGPEAIAILPIAIVTISEHIGDHTVLGQICGRQFLKEPGLHRTLIGDGIATSVSAFLGKFTALISTIPNAVLGGMSILLYGVIASNGLKVLIKERVDFAQMRNLIIASAMLVLGLGGAILKLGPVTLSGTALSAMTGIILNLILPYENKD